MGGSCELREVDGPPVVAPLQDYREAAKGPSPGFGEASDSERRRTPGELRQEGGNLSQRRSMCQVLFVIGYMSSFLQ